MECWPYEQSKECMQSVMPGSQRQLTEQGPSHLKSKAFPLGNLDVTYTSTRLCHKAVYLQGHYPLLLHGSGGSPRLARCNLHGCPGTPSLAVLVQHGQSAAIFPAPLLVMAGNSGSCLGAFQDCNLEDPHANDWCFQSLSKRLAS